MAAVASEIDQATADCTAGPDQRRHQRYVGLEAGVLRLAIRPEFRGRRGLIIDVSASGMGFLLADPVEPGTALVFELPVAGSTAITRLARVRHNRPHPVPPDAPWLPHTPALSSFFRKLFGSEPAVPSGDAWLVGCEFDQPLTLDEIRRLLDPVTAPGRHA